VAAHTLAQELGKAAASPALRAGASGSRDGESGM